MQVIFTYVQYSARRDLAFRGHCDTEVNFKQLLRLRTTDNTDPLFQESSLQGKEGN